MSEIDTAYLQQQINALIQSAAHMVDVERRVDKLDNVVEMLRASTNVLQQQNVHHGDVERRVDIQDGTSDRMRSQTVDILQAIVLISQSAKEIERRVSNVEAAAVWFNRIVLGTIFTALMGTIIMTNAASQITRQVASPPPAISGK